MTYLARIGLFMLLVLSPLLAHADTYFNSDSESCNASSHPTNWILCDDFDDGNWYAAGNDGPPPSNAANDGWFGCNDLGPNNSCRNPPPPAVTASGSGRGGTGYAAKSSPQGGDGGNSALGMHGFYPANATYGEIYVRMYLKFSSGYTANNNQKFFSLIGAAYSGGIDYGGIGRNPLQFEACPQWTCGQLDEGYLAQNQGNNLFMTGGTTWYYVEWRIKQNTYGSRNGVYEMWINDCGTTGVCTGSPTLRASYTSVGWQGGTTASGNIGSLWFDIWGNPSDVGDINIDNIVVATVPIGFAGSAPASSTSTSVSGSVTFSGSVRIQ